MWRCPVIVQLLEIYAWCALAIMWPIALLWLGAEWVIARRGYR